MAIFIPNQCSEREPGGWEDCTWCAGVMMENAARNANVRPSTRAEYEALRVAGGDGPAENPGNGSNNLQLVIGVQKRYGWTPRIIGAPIGPRPSWTTIMSHLAKPGDMGCLQGGMDAWPSSSHWRRWDRPFDGGHNVFVVRLDTSPRLWWMNPQAPNEFGGEFIPLTEAKRYYDAFVGGLVYARVGERAVVVLRYGGVRLDPPQILTIAVPAGRRANIRERPTTTSRLTGMLVNGTKWTAYQVTRTGQELAGSRTWYGDISGTRWLHSTAF